MANTVLDDGGSITITGLDANWTSTKYIIPTGYYFYPSASNDRFVILNGGDSGGTLFDSGVTGSSGISDPETRKTPVKPHIDIDHADITLDTAANAKVVIKYK